MQLGTTWLRLCCAVLAPEAPEAPEPSPRLAQQTKQTSRLFLTAVQCLGSQDEPSLPPPAPLPAGWPGHGTGEVMVGGVDVGMIVGRWGGEVLYGTAQTCPPDHLDTLGEEVTSCVLR